ncbi:hypothetical protein Tco_0658181 [Tanacetum coccineum]
MAISVILVSLDSFEESVGTPTGRVILFGTIPTTIPDTTPSVTSPTTHIDTTPIPTVSPTIPPSPDYTPASLDYSPAFDTEFDPSEDPLSDHIPPLPATSPFLSSTDNSSDSDIPDTPPSPTYGTPFTKTTLSTQSIPIAFGALRRRVMVLAPGQPNPHGRPYRYHLNRPVHMMTVRKRVGPLPTHHLSMRHSFDYSSLDHFSSDDSSRDSSSSSSSKSSSDSLRMLYLILHLVVHLLINHHPHHHRRPSHDSSLVSPSRKRSRSTDASVSLSSPTLRALSYACANLLPSPKRIRSPEIAMNLEGCSEDSFELYVPRETGLGVDFMDESFESSRHRGTELEMDVKINARVVVEAIDREEIKTRVRGPVEVRVNRVTHPMVAEDIPETAQEGVVEVTYETLGDLIVATGQQSDDMLERIGELKQDNRRLRDMIDVASQRVARTMPNTRSGASRTREGINEQIDRQMEVNVNGGNGDEGNSNGGNRNGGNGNGNGGGNGYNFRGFVPAQECTYQDFLKCQPLNFNGMEGVVGLTCWFEKMESVFHISNCPERYQVKYASCTLLNSALTWWNSRKRTIGIKAAYAMSWVELMKLMTEVYCLRNEELVLLCTRMVPNEEDKVERFVEGLLDNVQGNVIAAEPTKLQDAIRIANCWDSRFDETK